MPSPRRRRPRADRLAALPRTRRRRPRPGTTTVDRRHRPHAPGRRTRTAEIRLRRGPRRARRRPPREAALVRFWAEVRPGNPERRPGAGAEAADPHPSQGGGRI